MVNAINNCLDQQMSKDDSIILMGEDIGVDGGVFRVTDGLQAKYGKQRVIDSPLSEEGIIGTGIGMAVHGLKPVLEIQFSGFVYSGFEELVSHAARIRNRSRGRFHCPLVVRTPYGGGIRALEHHQESTETFFAHVPGLKVVIPSSPIEAKGLLASAIHDPDPVIFFESLKMYRAFKEEVPEEEYFIPLEKSNIVREGTDITLVSLGAIMRPTLAAADSLKEEGVSCEVIDLRTVFPMDSNTIIESVKKTGRCAIIHEAVKFLGIGAEITAQINEKALYELKAPVKRIAGYNTIIPLAQLEHYYLPDEKRILKEVKDTLKQ